MYSTLRDSLGIVTGSFFSGLHDVWLVVEGTRCGMELLPLT